MKNTLNINRLIQSKKNTTNILTDGGQRSGNEYITGTAYTGYVSVNGCAFYRQEVIPENIYINNKEYKSADGHGFMDITNRNDLQSLLQESTFLPSKKFPFDISMDYKGGNRLSLYAFENDDKEVEVHAYQTQYAKPIFQCKHVCLGSDLNSGRRALYALDENRKILAVVMPWLLRVESPLQSFIVKATKSWYVNGDDSLAGFETDLLTAVQRSKQYYDEKNKDRIEAYKRDREQREVEQEIEDAMRIDNLIKNMSNPESEISGAELIDVARSLQVELHPRTVGSIKKRVQKIAIKESGFAMSFYRTKGGAGIGKGVKSAIAQIIIEAKRRL